MRVCLCVRGDVVTWSMIVCMRILEFPSLSFSGRLVDHSVLSATVLRPHSPVSEQRNECRCS